MGSTRKLFVGLAAVLAAASLVVLAPAMARPAEAATLIQVTNFGANPGSLAMYAYVPTSVSARPAVLVAMHPCGGSGPGYYQSTEFASLADRYGFIVIYPSSTKR